MVSHDCPKRSDSCTFWRVRKSALIEVSEVDGWFIPVSQNLDTWATKFEGCQRYRIMTDASV